MGGRGSNSKKGSGLPGGGGMNPNDIMSTMNMGGMIAEGDRRQEAADVMSVAYDIVQRYGVDAQVATFVTAKLRGRSSQRVIGYYDGSNIGINERFFDSAAINDAYDRCVAQGYHPERGSKSGLQAVAAHEYGHALTDLASRKMGINSLVGLQSAADRIVTEAFNSSRYRDVRDFARAISGYASESYAETVAEAFADVYCNGNRAKSASRAVVSVLDKYLK